MLTRVPARRTTEIAWAAEDSSRRHTAEQPPAALLKFQGVIRSCAALTPANPPSGFRRA